MLDVLFRLLKASPVARNFLYGGLGIRKLQFLIKKSINFCFSCKLFSSSIFNLKTLDPDWIQIRTQWILIRNTEKRPSVFIRSGETLASGGKLLISCWMAGSMALVGPSCFSRSWIYEWQDSSTTVSWSTRENILTTVFRIGKFLGLPDPDPSPRGTDPAPSKNNKKNFLPYCIVTFLWLFICEEWCKCSTFKK